MKKSVLIEIIFSLGKKEIREIQKWLISPAHNQRQDVVKLFEYITDNLSADDANLEKERAWKSIFPKEPFDDAKMRQAMYFLLQNIEEYLAFSEMTKDPVHIQTVLLEVYRRHKLEKPFRLTMEAARKRQNSSPYRNGSFLKEQHTLEQEQYFYLVGQKWSMEINLQETSDALDLAYIADKLRLSCRMLAHQAIYKKITYDFGILSSVLLFVENHHLLENPAISIYYYGYKSMTDQQKEDYYNKFEDILFKNSSIFPDVELRELFLISINYCVIKINTGNASYLKRLFELYRYGFEKNILLENGMVSKLSFGNAVSSALKVKEFDWAEQFIKKFQHNVEEKFRNSIVNFSLSRILFEKGDYNKAQKLLTQFDYDDISLNIVAKNMLLKIYYEQEEFDAFENLLESLRSYIQRQKALQSTAKASAKNMISLMKKLLNLNPYSKAQVTALRELIISTNPLMEREWLLRQLDNMGRK